MKSLDGDHFLEDFPFVQTDEELQKLITAHSEIDGYYISSTVCRNRRAWFKELWKAHQDLADTKFCSQARKDFLGASWEMYLGYFLKNTALSVMSKDDGPDFYTEKIPRIYTEAIAVTKGDGEHAVPPLSYGIVSDIPTDKMQVRILSGLKEKAERFQKYIDEGRVDKPAINVIALNSGALDHPETPPPLIFRVCFGIGNLAMRIHPDKGDKEFFHHHQPDIKKGMVNIDSEFFLNRKNDHISAILYSHYTALNLQGRKDGLIVVHNPFATNPLPEDAFPSLQHFTWTGDRIHEIERLDH